MHCRAVFMATGMAAATLTHTAAALGIAPTAAVLAWPASDVANSGALLAATALLTFMGLARAAQAVGGRRCSLLGCCCSVGSLRHMSVVCMACLGHMTAATLPQACAVVCAQQQRRNEAKFACVACVCACRLQSQSLWSC